MRYALYFLAIASCLTVSLQATEIRPPDEVALDGGGTVPLVSHASRTHLLGTVEVYRLALYVQGSIDRERLASSGVAKAIRIEVTWVDDLRRPVYLDWRRELVPRLSPEAVAQLHSSFAALRTGDIVQIQYTPVKGTSVRVNKAVAVSGAHHDLMLAFLDHWLGQRPVSESMKYALLQSS